MEAVDLISDIGGPLAVLAVGYAVLKTRFNAHEKRVKEKEDEMEARLEKMNTSRRTGDERLFAVMEKIEDKLHARIDKTQEALKDTESKLEQGMKEGFTTLHNDVKELRALLIEKLK